MVRIYCTGRGENTGSAAVYALLDYAFRNSCSGDMPSIKKTPRGKPYFPERPDIHFSLSHGHTHVLCALSGSPVGADIESPRVIGGKALKFFCSRRELAMFDPLDLWVLKESYIKLFGLTLAEIRDLRFTREAGGRLLCSIYPAAEKSKLLNDEAQELSPRFTPVYSQLYRVDGCRAAVCAVDPQLPDSIELISSSADILKYPLNN